MNEEILREKLWNKVTKEFEEFKSKLLTTSKENIFSSAFLITTLADFKDMCNPECHVLNIDEVKVLLKEQYSIHTLYKFYNKTDAGTISNLHEIIWYQLQELVERYNSKNRIDIDR